jgi:hypothetical protein
MGESFDPYLQWLGIRDPQRPPNYYRLLGVELFEPDPDVLTNAVDRQMAHVRTFQSGTHSVDSQRILNELAGAKICLLNAERKAQYDAQLQAQQAAAHQMPAAVPGREAMPAQPEISTPAALWPAVARPVPLYSAPQSAAAGPVAEEAAPGGPDAGASDEGSPLVSIAIAVLVAMILVLLGLIVLYSSSPREESDESVATDGSNGGTAAEPDPEGKPQAEIEPKTKPEAKPEAKPQAKPETKREEKPETKPEVKLPPVEESIRLARAAMAARRVAAAQRDLTLAEKAAVAGSPEAAEVARLRAVLAHLETLEKALRRGMQRLAPGDKLSAGGVPITVVQASEDVLVLKAGQQEQRFSAETLPPRLALAVAGANLPDGAASSSLAKAALAIFDPAGDLDLAEKLCQDAAVRGATATELLVELKLARAARGIKEPSPEPAKPEKPDKPDVPDEAAQAKVRNEIHEVFQKEYASAQKPEEKAALARTLLNQAMETKDNPTARYVLLIEGRDLAVDAGDRALLTKALGGLARWYRVELLETAAATLTEAAKHSRASAANKNMAQEALSLARAAATQDRLEAAMELTEAAISMGRKAGDLVTVKNAVGVKRTIEEQQQSHQRFVEAGKTLAQSPDDPPANLTRGTYLCFVKNTWSEGLPLLAKGNDAALKALAEAELARPAQPADKVVLGDRWWDAADTVGEDLRPQFRARAAHWYQQALEGVTGLTKTKVQRRLQEVKQ